VLSRPAWRSKWGGPGAPGCLLPQDGDEEEGEAAARQLAVGAEAGAASSAGLELTLPARGGAGARVVGSRELARYYR